jgi:GNAT superfamily N-acetyltransferase
MNWYKLAQKANMGFTKLLGPSEEGLYYIKAIDRDSDKVVGMLELETYNNEWYIGQITVLPEYRRQGIATNLIHVASEQLGKNIHYREDNATLDSGIHLIDSLRNRGMTRDDYYDFGNRAIPPLVPNNSKKHKFPRELSPYLDVNL